MHAGRPLELLAQFLVRFPKLRVLVLDRCNVDGGRVAEGEFDSSSVIAVGAIHIEMRKNVIRKNIRA